MGTISVENTKILSGKRVLMAEDNDLNAQIATIQLESCGVTVTRAVDGKNVVEIFTANPAGTFDFILMDIRMPKLNGYEATSAIRELENRPDGKKIPIIAMTADALEEEADSDKGMDGHIVKPIDLGTLAKTIQTICEVQ